MSDPITAEEASEMTLAELFTLAKDVMATYTWTDFLNDYYDPMRSTLLTLLVAFGIVEGES